MTIATIISDKHFVNGISGNLETFCFNEPEGYGLDSHEKQNHLLDVNERVNGQVGSILTGISQSIPVESPHTTLEPTRYSTSAIPFGKDDWESFFGNIGVEPKLPSNIEEILNEPCSFWPDKQVRKTHILVLLPKKINGKLFTMNYLRELIQEPKSGHATKYTYYDRGVEKRLGKDSYSSRWLLMTRDVIPGSRNKNYSEQSKLVTRHSKKTGLPYTVPRTLEATVSILMHYVKTGERLYGNDPLTYTRCKEKIRITKQEKWPVAIGNFEPSGIHVDYVHDCSGRYDNFRGVAAVRKL